MCIGIEDSLFYCSDAVFSFFHVAGDLSLTRFVGLRGFPAMRSGLYSPCKLLSGMRLFCQVKKGEAYRD